MLVVTNLRTDTGCTDDGKEGVSLWPHRHLNTWEQLREFVLILVCWADCVDKYLKKKKVWKTKRTLAALLPGP